MAEIDMLAYGKKKGRPSKAMKAMPKYDDNFDANARRKGVTNKNFNKAEIDKLVKAKVKAEVEAKMDQFVKKDWVPTKKSSPKANMNYGRITDTQYPDAGLKYSDNYSPAKYDTQFGSKSSGWTAEKSGSSVMIDGSKFAKQKYGNTYSVNTGATDALTNMANKSRAGVPTEKLPPVMSDETFIAGNKPKLPPVPTAAEQALATTASNLDNAKNVSKLDKVKGMAGKVKGGAGGFAGNLLKGYGGYDVGQRLASGAAGLFTDDEDIKGIAGTVGGIAGGAAATMIPALRLPSMVYGGVKAAADVYDMLSEPSKAEAPVEDTASMQQSSPAQPTIQDLLIADLLAGKSGKGGKSKSDDALATMLALANQGTSEANARRDRLRAMDEAGMLDVDILK